MQLNYGALTKYIEANSPKLIQPELGLFLLEGPRLQVVYMESGDNWVDIVSVVPRKGEGPEAVFDFVEEYLYQEGILAEGEDELIYLESTDVQ